MEPEDPKISVWICQEEKLISGLSKRTTCSDVVRVLLEDSKQGRRRRGQPGGQQSASLQEGGGGGGGGMLSGPPQSYCIVEKWRGFERILPNKTKILRLWAAWGDEQENVRFVLVRSEASLPNAGPRSAEARVVPSKERPCLHARGAATRAGLALSQERQRRVVRKAFRKLAKLNRRKGQPPLQPPPPRPRSPQPPSPLAKDREEDEEDEVAAAAAEEEGAVSAAAERMETLVHLVLSQDHTIRQQVKRLRDLDREIDRYEARIHFDRVKRHGVNYVQETYLVGGEPEPPGGEEPPAQGARESPAGGGGGAALGEYVRKCEQVAALQEQWRRQEALVEQLAGEIQEELNARWMRRRREELAAARGSSASLSETDCNTTELIGGGELHVEQERVKTQLSTSLYIGLRLSTDLDAVKSDLEATQRAWAEKERELHGLLGTLRSLGVEEEEEEEEETGDDGEEEEAGGEEDGTPSASPCPGAPDPAPTIPSEVWSEEAARTLCKEDCEEENDEDSDTGLSSMHSQDSDSVPVCESLV